MVFSFEEAIARGYKNVLGVEPSIDALNKANPSIRRSIINDVMRPGLFEPDRFDVICMFQVLDHIPDPEIFLKECFSVLKPGGLVLCLNHNIEALSAYFFKENSPIVDIEHTYLYSPKTISKVFSLRGFKILETGSVLNNYTLHYLVRLLPMPRQLKNKILSVLSSSLIGRLRLAVPLGNLYLIAQKPK
ncbi:MAG: class I SAM-dependent methyltransferase [Candidatus Omnitrophica bacterium]|nr:class I SAM-dependent methyltransferase [Candidatus Omnitrophota bacterium]